MTRDIPTDENGMCVEVGTVSPCDHVALHQRSGEKRGLVYDGKGETHELKRIRVKRNVKWASTLEEFWDGLEKKRPVCGARKAVRPILKKSAVVRRQAVREQGSMSPVSDASDTSCQLIEDDVVKRPRRLKFTLRCGRKDSATSTFVTLSSM